MRADNWNTHAASFERDVFHPVANDLHGTLVTTLESVSSKSRSAADLGCGTGRLLPTLAELFRSVLATDQSERYLQMARKRCQSIDTVTFLRHDLSSPFLNVKQVDVGVCINVAIMQSYQLRMRLLKNVAGLIRPRGRLVLLVPSMESVLLSVHRLVLWNLEETKTYRQAATAASSELAFTARSVRDGVIKVGGIPTKHYLREELELLVQELGQRVCSIEKVQYAWHTEFEDPPESMGAPYPWDWLVVSKPWHKNEGV